MDSKRTYRPKLEASEPHRARLWPSGEGGRTNDPGRLLVSRPARFRAPGIKPLTAGRGRPCLKAPVDAPLSSKRFQGPRHCDFILDRGTRERYQVLLQKRLGCKRRFPKTLGPLASQPTLYVDLGPVSRAIWRERFTTRESSARRNKRWRRCEPREVAVDYPPVAGSSPTWNEGPRNGRGYPSGPMSPAELGCPTAASGWPIPTKTPSW